jgi:hypothetical protein
MDSSMEPGSSTGPARAERRRQLLQTMRAARRGTSTDENRTSTSTGLTAMETAGHQSEESDPIGLPERLATDMANGQSDTTREGSMLPTESSLPQQIEAFMSRQEDAANRIAEITRVSDERISRLGGMTHEYEAFSGELTEALNRSDRLIEDTVLTLKRTEYLLGHLDDRNRRGQEVLARVEMLIQNADGVLSAGKRELQSEAAMMRRYIARKVAFAPLLLLLTSLLLAVSALTWWTQGRVRGGQVPTVGMR